ncbi:MAG: hypothetical protein JNL90_06870 [Planctomycetes bacterium]|nr:hypothetical protein [Planctomycetota bacterium]
MGERRRGRLLRAASGAALVALASAALPAGCSEAPRAPPAVNTIVVALHGARADLLEELAASGGAPTFAAWRAAAGWRGERRVDTVERAAAAAELDALLANWLGPAEAAPDRARARFVSHSDLAHRGDPSEAAPALAEFGRDLAGAKAAPLELTRDAQATAAAAARWLADAASPFTLLLQFEAGACTSDAPLPPRDLDGPALRERARATLLGVDRALAPLVELLARGGRDRRTRIVVATTGGEAQGEEGAFGPRHDLPAVRRALLWRIEPGGATALPPPPIRSTASADPPLPAASLDPRALPLAWVAPPRPAEPEEARARLALLPPSLRGASPRLAEREWATLLELSDPTAEEAARRTELAARFAAPSDRAELRELRLLTRFARGELAPGLATAERLSLARRALALAPWYFPAARTAASLLQAKGDPLGALAQLESFGAEAPLAPAAAAEFAALLATTRKNLETALPSGRR